MRISIIVLMLFTTSLVYPQSSRILLDEDFPNPFNPETLIGYTVPIEESKQSVRVQLKVYDILGKEIAILVNTNQPAGYYEVKFDSRDYPALVSGIYFYAILVGNNFDVKK